MAKLNLDLSDVDAEGGPAHMAKCADVAKKIAGDFMRFSSKAPAVGKVIRDGEWEYRKDTFNLPKADITYIDSLFAKASPKAVTKPKVEQSSKKNSDLLEAVGFLNCIIDDTEWQAFMSGSDPRAKKVDHLTDIPQTYDLAPTVHDEIPAPTGWVGRLYEYALQENERHMPAVAQAVALSTVSALSQNRFVANSWRTTALNLYIMVVASTGLGKEATESVVQRLLSIAGRDDLIAPRYASEPAVLQHFRGAPNKIRIIDEFGKFMNAIAKDGGGHQDQVLRIMMEFYSKPLGRYAPQYKASDGGTNPAPINNPYLSILAMSTATRFWGALTLDHLLDGSINRFTILVQEGAPLLDNLSFGAVPPDLEDWLKALAAFCMNPTGSLIHEDGSPVGTGNLAGFTRRSFTQIKFDPLALRYIKWLRKYYDSEKIARHRGEIASASSARATQNIIKIAGILALGDTDNFENAIIERRHVAWAHAVVTASVGRTVEAAESVIGATEGAQDAMRLLDVIKDLSSGRRKVKKKLPDGKGMRPYRYDLEGGGVAIGRWVILKCAGMTAREAEPLLDTLVQRGDLIHTKQELDGAGRRADLYVVVD